MVCWEGLVSVSCFAWGILLLFVWFYAAVSFAFSSFGVLEVGFFALFGLSFVWVFLISIEYTFQLILPL